MVHFEKKLMKGAWELREQIKKSKFALSRPDKYDISREEQLLIRMNIHAMEISHECLIRRIALRGLIVEYAKFCIKSTFRSDDCHHGHDTRNL